MHPRDEPPAVRPRRARERTGCWRSSASSGEVHPREVDAHFAHGTVTNYWGGSSSATTHLLEDMHYRGLAPRHPPRTRHPSLRGCGTRARAAAAGRSPRERVDALVDVVVNKYAPLPALVPVVCSSGVCATPSRSGTAQIGRRTGARESAAARTREWTASTGTGRRGSTVTRGSPRRCGAAARAVRSGRLGPPALRAVLGMAVSFRGLHAGRQAQARLLRAAAAVARSRHRLGRRSPFATAHSIRSSATSADDRRATAASSAAWTRNWSGCARSSG